MKLATDQIAFIHRGLCEAGYMASADALLEHIRDVTQERDTLLSLVHEKVSLAMTAIQYQCSHDDGQMDAVPSEVNGLLDEVLDLLDAGGADKARAERQKLIDERDDARNLIEEMRETQREMARKARNEA